MTRKYAYGEKPNCQFCEQMSKVATTGFGLDVELHIFMPGVDKATAEKLVELAHEVCPYSNATRGNIPVKLIVEEQPIAAS